MIVPIFPHVVLAGAEKLREAREANASDESTALAVYLAMDELIHCAAIDTSAELH